MHGGPINQAESLNRSPNRKGKHQNAKEDGTDGAGGDECAQEQDGGDDNGNHDGDDHDYDNDVYDNDDDDSEPQTNKKPRHTEYLEAARQSTRHSMYFSPSMESMY